MSAAMELRLQASRPVAAASVCLAAVAIEWLRALAARVPGLGLAELLIGGAALCLLGLLFPPSALGFHLRLLPLKVAGGLVLGALLVLPAWLRSAPLPQLPVEFASAAVIISVGEEVAFRGAAYAALRAMAGAPAAIVGSSVLFTLGHVLSHPPAFLLPVFALGLLLALWRWALDDLAGPIAAHVFADLAL